MQKTFRQGWRDLQLELQRKLEPEIEIEEHADSSLCPDCGNDLYFLEGGFLCPVCGYSIETVYS